MSWKTIPFLSLSMTLALCVGPVFAMPSEAESISYAKMGTKAQRGEEAEIRSEVKVKTRAANVRRGPSLDFRRKFVLRKGDTALVKGTRGEWYLIELDNGREGWARKDLFFASVRTRGETTEAGPQKAPLDSPVESQETATLSNTESLGPSMGSQIASSDPPKAVVSSAGKLQETLSVSKREEQGSSMGSHTADPGLISINYVDVDIRKALSTLALEQELNIATAKGVSGKISVHLYQVNVDKALEAIVHAGGFSYHTQGNVYYVYKTKEERDPQAERLQVRVFKLRYGDVEKVQEVLDALLGTRVIKIHEATKTIVVEDTPENIGKIENIINYWDRMPRQVMIEAKILEVALTDDMSLGVNWEKILGDARIGAGGLSAATLPITGSVSPVPATGKGIFANIITGAGSRHQFAVALDALRSKTKLNTLSTPKIMAIHGETAKVQVGGEQGYKETTLSGTGLATESIKFIQTGTILQMTPYIDDESNVLLNVKPSIKSARIEEGIPVVTSTEVSTWLLAKNGETVFIGGLIQDTKSNTRDMLPCLGNIPGIGAIFARNTQDTRKSELVVLITPRIFDAEQERASKHALEKTRKVEERFKKEPQPEHKQILEFLFPPREGKEK